MSEIQVASRYAKSLLDLAVEQNALEPIKNDIESFISVCRSNSQLQAVLANPIIGPDKKVAILKALFGEKVDPVVLAFFTIMVNKGRAAILFGTAREFVNEYNVLKGVVKASVVSAAPLSETNKQEIIQLIKEATHGEVELETKVNPELIGGFILTVGDRQFDTTIASSLNRLKKEFAKRVVA